MNPDSGNGRPATNPYAAISQSRPSASMARSVGVSARSGAYAGILLSCAAPPNSAIGAGPLILPSRRPGKSFRIMHAATSERLVLPRRPAPALIGPAGGRRPCVRHDPRGGARHAGAALNDARALLACGQAARALEAATDACRFSPTEGQFLRGCALNALGRWPEAIRAFEAVIAADPGHAAAHLNLGNAHADLDRWPEAERLCRIAIGLDPACPEAHASLGFVLTATGRLVEAVAACERAIGLRPDFAQAHWNRACALLLAGDYARGFEAYEWRKRHPRFLSDFPALPGPEWRGEALNGRVLLVRSEQGLGDTIQFARYLPLLAARGAEVTLICDRPLVPLLSRMPGVSRVVAKGGMLPRLRSLDRPAQPAPAVCLASGDHPRAGGLSERRSGAGRGLARAPAGGSGGRHRLRRQSGARQRPPAFAAARRGRAIW